jgi:hypothetical protein
VLVDTTNKFVASVRDDVTEHEPSFDSIGAIEQVYVHEPGDFDGPVIRIVGTDGSVSCVVTDESVVDYLTEVAAELQTVFDEQTIRSEMGIR